MALPEQHGPARAMELLGGDTDHWVGLLELGVLRNLGLESHQAVVDVGCGTGRLSVRLAAEHAGPFLGTDLLPEIVDYARQRTGRADWQFTVAVAPPVPAADATVEWVTFFSVFTHILDEDIYAYLRDAKRMLKSGGRVVFSFLDYSVEDHWATFESSLADQSPNRPIVHFLNRNTIERWCGRLGLRLERVYDGPEAWIGLGPPLVLHDLTAPFWQSIAVLTKP